MLRKVIWLVASATLVSVIAAGCGDDDEDTSESNASSEDEPRHGLTKAQAAEVLVKVGDTSITVGEFAERLADQSPYLRARYNSPERRREFLENMIRFELLAQEAESRGMTKLPEVQRTRRQVMIQQMMKELFEDRIQLADVTDEEVREYFEEHQEEFNQPEQVRASHILIKDRAQAERVLAQARERESDVSRFRELAEEHNEDPTTSGQRRGDLRFFSQDGTRNRAAPRQPGGEEGLGRVPPAVAAAAFAIDRIGGIAPELVETGEGFHIVKLTGRRAALRRTLEDSRRTIQNRLWREKRQQAIDDFVARLREDSSVEENLGALDSVRIDTSGAGEGPGPAHPSGADAADRLLVPDGPGATDPSPTGESANGATGTGARP